MCWCDGEWCDGACDGATMGAMVCWCEMARAEFERHSEGTWKRGGRREREERESELEQQPYNGVAAGAASAVLKGVGAAAYRASEWVRICPLTSRIVAAAEAAARSVRVGVRRWGLPVALLL